MFAAKNAFLTRPIPVSFAIKGTPTVSSTSSVPIPAHSADDLIILFAHSSGAGLPGMPSAGGTVPAWTSINTGTGSFSQTRTARFKATGSSHTSGTWTNTTSMIAVVISGAHATTPIGGQATATETFGGNPTAPAVTMSQTNGTSILLHFYGTGDGLNACGTPSTAPANYTRQIAGGPYTTPPRALCLNTKNVTTSDGSIAQTFTGVGSYYAATTIEVLAA